MTGQNRGSRRVAGWVLSGLSATGLLTGAAALALAADRPPPVLVLDLGHNLPAAPSLAAIADSAPQVTEQAPATPETPAPEKEGTTLPITVPTPEFSRSEALRPPKMETPATAELALPPLPEKPAPKEKPAEEETQKPDRPTEKTRTERGAEASAGAAAPSPANRLKAGGTISPAAYAKAVMKKVRATKRKSGVGRGTVIIGFTIADDGGLAAVQVLQGSGNAGLDTAALDHIRRSAPFPPVPDGVSSSFSFEFVGR